MDENNPVVDESLMSTAEVKGKHKRRHSKCWNFFTIEGDRMPDGKFKCVCNYCNHFYILDLHKSGTNTLLRHSRTCPKTPNKTCPKNAFVEYRRVREALHYANPTIEFWCRN
ncbi:unnamed protein product, partial [Brassica oleracea var. botrytis]